MGENLPARIKYLLDTESKHDCFFVVGPDDGPVKRIGAIKILLMAASDPFRVMLGDGELAETGDIRVKDVEPEIFKSFIKCIYGANSVVIPKLNFGESAKLLYVMEKYLVHQLKSELINHMENLLSFENIFVALSHTICYEIASINQEMSKILKYNFSEITNQAQFLELDVCAVTWMLEQERIKTKEIEIWDAVLKWAKHKTNSSEGKVVRSYVFGLLKYIRFLSMDYTEFLEGVVSSGVLFEEEMNDICKSFVLSKPCSLEHLCKRKSNRYSRWKVSTNINSVIIEDSDTAFIHCSASSISDFQTNKSYYSKTYPWAGHFWSIAVAKGKVEEVDSHLVVGLFCDGKTSNWSCTVDFEVRLINHSKKSDIRKKYIQTFSPSNPFWAGYCFYNWNALVNPTSGFVVGNSIVIDVRIKLNR